MTRHKVFALSLQRHVGFGVLVTLRIEGQPERRLTKQEAAIVARGLNALATGAAKERKIFMSPIASDYDLDVSSIDDRLVVSLDGAPSAAFSRADAFALIAELQQAAGV